jgi:hypothetical protein
MSSNGSNEWNVPFSDIAWFERLLRTHRNVNDVSRHDDIVFNVERVRQRDQLTILCCRQYAMGITLVHRALAEFGRLSVIYIGGGWNGYTSEAKDFCVNQQIGLYVTDEMSGALWRDDYWAYHRRDSEGNPEFFVRD